MAQSLAGGGAIARIAAVVGAVALLLLALSGPMYRFGILSLQNAFLVLRWSAYAGIAAPVVAVVGGALAYRRGARMATVLSAAAFVAGLVALAIPLQWLRTARSVPPIHDITTDLENPPTYEAVVPLRVDARNSLERPPQLAEQQRKGYPDLAPITLPLPVDRVFDGALTAAQDAGWEIVTADKGSGRIEATDTTRWFGFKDDVVVRLTPWGSGTRVDVRSVSRVGGSDVGTNARRIRDYLERLQSTTGG
jgi:uncharacterized protein (DUF1499 family)